MSSLFPGVINWLNDGLTRLNALGSDRKALRARTLYTLGVLNRVVHNYASARQAWEESIELLRECSDLPTLSLALADLSWLLAKSDPPLALCLVKESEAAARQEENPWNLAYALLVSMVVIGDVESDERLALACGQESLALFRATGDPWKPHWTQTILAGKGQDPLQKR